MAPLEFNEAIRKGGKVITKKFKGGKYMHLVKKPGGGWVAGEIKTKKEK